MKTGAAVMLFVMLITGCGHSPKKLQDVSTGVATAEAEFLQQNGPLVLKFDSDGNWRSIETTATASIDNDSPAGRETAFTVATLRAKRNIAEFLASDVDSSRSVESVAKSRQQSNSASDDEAIGNQQGESDDPYQEAESGLNSPEKPDVNQSSSRLITIVRERVADDAQAILKGVRVLDRKIASGARHVSVTLAVSKKSIGAAEQVRRAMEAT